MEREEEKSSLIRRLVTIISADVAGYSRLMAEDESGTLRIFREHKKVFESFVKLHRGRVFNTAGDAILAEFPSAVEAVRCATEIQAALRTANARYPENRKVQFRIGVNLGDVIEQGTDLLGDGVNLAARIQTSAEPGGICISGGVYDQIASKLQLHIESLGERSYKNIPQPVRTFTVMSGKRGVPLPAASPAKTLDAGISLLKRAAPYAAAGVALVGFLFLFLRHPAATQTAVVAEPSLPVPEKLAPLAAVAPAGSAQFTVSPGANAISAAVLAAKPGDVIAIQPGVYKEHLSLSKSVTLRGLPGPDGKIAVRIENDGSETIAVNDGDVALENLEVVLRPKDGSQTPSAVIQLGGNLKARNISVICGGAHPAIGYSLRDGSATLQDSNINGRRGIEQLGGKLVVDGCVADGNQEEGAIVLNQGGAAGFSTEIRGLRANHNGKQGLAVMDNANATITGGQFNENGVNGVGVMANGVARFSGSEVSNNKENGIVVSVKGKVTFTNGKATGNHFSGIAGINDSQYEVSGSELTGNGEFGYATLDHAVAVEGAGNHIAGNRGGATYRVPASSAPPGAKK
jgi:class 3 adenylate cyclase